MAEVSTSPVPDAQLFRDAFDASPIGIAVENLDGQPLFVNPAFCRFLGFTEKELRGKHCVDFSPREDAEKDWALFQQLKAGSIDHYQMEKRYFRRDGSLVWGRLSISLFKSHPSPQVIALVEDITDKKNAEEELRSSEERLRLAAKIGKMYAYSWDVTTDEVVRSPEYVNVLGVSDQHRFTRQQLLEKLHPDDRASWIASAAELTPDNPTCNITYRVLRPDGSEVWLEKNARAFFDTNGKMLRVIGMVADVTERKLVQEALRASEERLRLAQQAARIGSFEWNIRTGANTWTPELEAMYGLPPGGFGGTQTAFKNLLHPDDRTRVMKLADSSLKTAQPTTGEWRVIWPDGSVHWIASRWQVFVDDSGEPLRMAGVNIDITQRKLAEQKLHEYERAVEGSGEMIVVVDREYRYLIANRQFLKMRNITREQVVGHSVRELMTRPEIFEEIVKPKLDECFQGKVVRYEMKYPYPQLGERDLLISYFPIEGDSGIDHATCILHDITERKRAEEALADMTRKLIDAQEQERARIARELHDDINQRLALLSVELEASRQNPPDTATDMSMLLTDLRERIDEISSDVHSISRQLHSSQLEYLGIVAAARSFCREFSASQNVEVDFNHDDIPRSVPQDISLCLFRVLQEALHNAVKYSKVRHFEVRLSCSENQLSLTVSDRGVGFDPESALSRGGLGLTSMKERVRLINGTISIESKPMHGTTIRVRVPLTSEHDSEELAG